MQIKVLYQVGPSDLKKFVFSLDFTGTGSGDKANNSTQSSSSFSLSFNLSSSNSLLTSNSNSALSLSQIQGIQQGRLLPIDYDPSLWKCTVIDQIQFDCLHRQIRCVFIDSEYKTLPMSDKCWVKIMSAIKILEFGDDGDDYLFQKDEPILDNSMDFTSFKRNSQGETQSTTSTPSSSTSSSPSTSKTNSFPSSPSSPSILSSFGRKSGKSLKKDMEFMNTINSMSDMSLANPSINKKIRSVLLDVVNRFVISELKFPSNAAIWNAESSLLKQEKRLLEIDTELDKQARQISEIKQKLKEMRLKFMNSLEKNESNLQKCGPLYLEALIEGFEQDVLDTNKDLTASQNAVDRFKKQITELTQQSVVSTPSSPFTASPYPPSSPFPAGDDSEGGGSSVNVFPKDNKNLLREMAVANLDQTTFQNQTDQLNEKLARARFERDMFFNLINPLIEVRERCKNELRHRQKDNERNRNSLCQTNEGEYEYMDNHRKLKELRNSRNFLSHDKLMVISAREVSKMELRNLNESMNAYLQKCEQERIKKRKMKRMDMGLKGQYEID